MKGVLSVLGWVSAALLTFLAVSLAFLVLANFGSSSQEVQIVPESSVARTASPLEMSFDQASIDSLSDAEKQPFSLSLANGGAETLRDINVILEVSSEDTSVPDTNFYRRTLPTLEAGEEETLTFDIDLSPPENDGKGASTAESPPREIVEARATTPGGISSVATVILPIFSSEEEGSG